MLMGGKPRIWVALEPTDMRLGMDGLCARVQQQLAGDPYGGVWFVFRNKAGTRLKVLHYDGLGFWLHYRRLERSTFVWPLGSDTVMEMTDSQFLLLTQGQDWRVVRRVIHPVPSLI
jgi:transposase